MAWLWLILHCLFPGDPLRQVAEAMRHRALQLLQITNDPASLEALQQDPRWRLHLELLILDAEDSLRLWIAMRGCQIARIRPGLPHRRTTPHLTQPKSVLQLLARIATLAEACELMEQRAQSHARRLTRLRDADPLGAHKPAGCIDQDDARPRATSSISRRTSLFCSMQPALAPTHATTLVMQRGPPLHSIAGTHPQHASQASPARSRLRASASPPRRGTSPWP